MKHAYFIYSKRAKIKEYVFQLEYRIHVFRHLRFHHAAYVLGNLMLLLHHSFGAFLSYFYFILFSFFALVGVAEDQGIGE